MRILITSFKSAYLRKDWTFIKILQEWGNEVRVVLPKENNTGVEGFRPIIQRMEVRIGEREVSFNIKGRLQDGILTYIVGKEKESLTDDESYILFSRVILRLFKLVDWRPEVIHCNGWQMGLLPVYVHPLYCVDPFYERAATVFTVHDLGDEKLFPKDRFSLTDLKEEVLSKLLIGERYSFRRGGILFSDLFNTVSKGYAEEVKKKDPLLLKEKDLEWVLHGIDYEMWNPANDSLIYKRYDPKRLKWKSVNKEKLLHSQKLKRRKFPLVGMILESDEEVDLISRTIDGLMKYGILLIVLVKERKPSFGGWEVRFSSCLRISFNYEEIVRKLYAGADILVLPSLHEPHGQGAMIALRYGTPPVVMASGGFKDVVREFNPTTLQGTGFVFHEYTEEAFLDAIGRGIFFYKNKRLWERLIMNGMKADFSIKNTSKRYLELYKMAAEKHLKKCLSF